MKNKIDINKEFLIMCEVPHWEGITFKRRAKFIGLINYIFLSNNSWQTLDKMLNKCSNKGIYLIRKKDIQMILGNFFIVEDGYKSFEVLCNKVEILKFLKEKTGK